MAFCCYRCEYVLLNEQTKKEVKRQGTVKGKKEKREEEQAKEALKSSDKKRRMMLMDGGYE